jgi:hypothetical protein
LSQFQPNNITLDPPPGPDTLAGAVLKSLSRPIGQKLSWSVVRSLVLALLSFGVLPIIAWMRSFGAFVTAEQQQYLHLAQWVRQNAGDHPLARRLESDARELRPRALLTFATAAALLITVFGVASDISYDHELRDVRHWDALVAGTYGYSENPLLNHRPVWHYPGSHPIHNYWIVGLAAAYACHWLQVQLHAQDVKRFVARFSQVAQAEGVNAVRAQPLGTPFRPLWLAAGALMFAWGAPWGILAMLAGAAQRRYITWSSRSTRADVAQRLRTMLVRRRPVAAGVPVPVYLRVRCVEDKCRAEIPRGVNFCPRCGTRQEARLNRTA